MNVDFLVKIIGADFFTGVPDSQLKMLCSYLMEEYGTDPKHHIIAANEGNCTAIAAGYYLATGKAAVVYMQNSGEGNIINPVASLLNDKVYAIPCIFIIGWRGEPGQEDEPQHIYQGEVTVKLLEDMNIVNFVIGKDTTERELQVKMEEFNAILSLGKSIAFVIQKDALFHEGKVEYKNSYHMMREEIIKHIIEITGEDLIVSTTGRASRELFEARVRKSQSHKYDFLSVGSMGHSSSIAFGVALNKPQTKVWCIDGDGAVLMHMGSMAIIGSNKPDNLIHIIINNGAHETVGGMPTVGNEINLVQIAFGCGYPNAVCVENFESLDKALIDAKKCGTLMLIEVKTAIGARDDLGRPTTTASENKESFMHYLSTLS